MRRAERCNQYPIIGRREANCLLLRKAAMRRFSFQPLMTIR
jgi:hypothetical protein